MRREKETVCTEDRVFSPFFAVWSTVTKLCPTFIRYKSHLQNKKHIFSDTRSSSFICSLRRSSGSMTCGITRVTRDFFPCSLKFHSIFPLCLLRDLCSNMSDIRVYDSFSTHSPAHASILPDLSCTAFSFNSCCLLYILTTLFLLSKWRCRKRRCCWFSHCHDDECSRLEMTKEVSEAGRMLFMTEVLCYSFFILHVVFKTW